MARYLALTLALRGKKFCYGIFLLFNFICLPLLTVNKVDQYAYLMALGQR